ncbi:MAG: DNA-directed RNA polymerase subunit omega [Oscillospiraceae bacterium]|jgi:DNA-directed RNA polymerase omega subunit|nr:DNA-directed RNA polymerase subunit omega [Oscillospiraceae bacterium]
MLKPSVKELMKNIPSRYLLVNVAAQRAREIAETAEMRRERLSEKPVKIAINEIADNRLIGQMKEKHMREQW